MKTISDLEYRQRIFHTEAKTKYCISFWFLPINFLQTVRQEIITARFSFQVSRIPKFS